MASQVKYALAMVKFKPSRDDPRGSSLQFFIDVMTELRCIEHAMSHAPIHLITQLRLKLQPPRVRQAIQFEHNKRWPEPLKCDCRHFMDKVMETSVRFAQSESQMHSMEWRRYSAS